MTANSELRRAVKAWFDGLGQALEALSTTEGTVNARTEQVLRATDNVLELEVMRRIAEHADEARPVVREDGVFIVALSPSPSWDRASFVELKLRSGGDIHTVALRTGISIRSELPGDDGTTEMDVVIANVADDKGRLSLEGRFVLAAVECKAHNSNIPNGEAEKFCTKARRVWTLREDHPTNEKYWWSGIPRPRPQTHRVPLANGKTCRGALLSLETGATVNAIGVLEAHNLSFLQLVELDQWVVALLEDLTHDLTRAEGGLEHPPIDRFGLLLSSSDPE